MTRNVFAPPASLTVRLILFDDFIWIIPQSQNELT